MTKKWKRQLNYLSHNNINNNWCRACVSPVLIRNSSHASNTSVVVWKGKRHIIIGTTTDNFEYKWYGDNMYDSSTGCCYIHIEYRRRSVIILDVR
mmetsp:Transcript_1178/g.1288  ORF Transcript_1178/g.1288 Transcript_1178/m.1288 type:complete len:95 (-) Transcript_1178:196-480(-)